MNSPTPNAPPAERPIAHAEASLERAFLFGDERPFAQCHASTLVETRDGRTVVAFFAGTHEGHPDVAIWTVEGRAAGPASTRAAARGPTVFGPARRALKVRDVAHWNPVLYRLEGKPEAGTETLALQFKIGERIRTWQTWIARSFNSPSVRARFVTMK